MKSGSAGSSFELPSNWLRATVRGYYVREYRLTGRQLDVFELLVSGKDKSEVALQLFLSPSRVRDIIHELYEALNIKGRGLAALVAHWHGVSNRAVDGLRLFRD